MNEYFNICARREFMDESDNFYVSDIELTTPVKVEEKRIGGFSAYYNPDRAKYLVEKGEATRDLPYIIPHNAKNDVFCAEHDRIRAEQKIGNIELKNNKWEILNNLYPILNFHYLLLPTSNIKCQHLFPEYVDDLLTVSRNLPGMTLAVNSWRAGASQNHFHAHMFNREFPALERERTSVLDSDGGSIQQLTDYPIICLSFEGTNGSERTLINASISELMQRRIPYNGIFFDGKFYLVPRCNEFDDDSISRGVDSTFGMFPTTSKCQFDTFESNNAENILTSIGYRSMFLAGVQIST